MRKNRKERIWHNRGVTLFEVMIAIALFAIIITPIMSTFVNSIRVNQKARKVMVATDVAQSIMEGISGKTYQEVWGGMQTSLTGFSFASGSSNANLAFSTINENYYNSKHSERLANVPDVAIAAEAKYAFPDTLISDINNMKDNKYQLDSSVAGMDFNTVISTSAVQYLKWMISSTEPRMPYKDTGVDADHPYSDAVGNPMTSDKFLAYGYSTQFYVDGDGNKTEPLISYMVYTRIQKDNYFFDAVVSFVPNGHVIPSGGTKTDALGQTLTSLTDEYYTYKVRVTVYEYQYEGKDDSGVPQGYNATDGTWPSRFNGDYFEGTPIAIMESGIPYKK